MQHVFSNLYFALTYLRNELITHGILVQTEKWQGIEKPPLMLEVLNPGFSARMPLNIDSIINQINPNLPWADLHFNERVSGIPTNPGEAYKTWPWYGNISQSNTRFQKEEKFSHTYQERFWPKLANSTPELGQNLGIRYPYGDLSDLVNLLYMQPFTRQAYLPIWFPEDTGVMHGGRVPCSLGYHFIMRDNLLHIHYTLRSCDAVRHLRNDIYFTVKLVYWVLTLLRAKEMQYEDKEKVWALVNPGVMTLQIISLHCFEKEKNLV